MVDDLVLPRQVGRILILTLNNPDRRNALSLAMREQLRSKLEDAAEEVAGIVLTGAGSYFCSGGDLRDPAGMNADAARFDHLSAIVDSIATNRLPVIAAVEGGAFGSGLGLALACDHVVCGQGAKLGTPFGKVGLSADAGLTWSLPRRIGAARATRLLLEAAPLDARTAQEWGMVDELTRDGDAESAAVTRMEAWLENAPLAIAASKKAMVTPPSSLAEALESEKTRQLRLLRTADAKEAITAFTERRTPRFYGR